MLQSEFRVNVLLCSQRSFAGVSNVKYLKKINVNYKT